jgi:Flp pilus assembly protein TadG
MIWKDQSGAVAPVMAIAMFALVGAAGLAFDYARLASMDSELQGAADQAALAAASQLDGKTGAQTRAISAAQNLISNQSRFANGGQQAAITVPTIAFYTAFSDASSTAATGDANSNYVQVSVGTKKAYYALTPIVRAVSSGNISASAVAGWAARSAKCRR